MRGEGMHAKSLEEVVDDGTLKGEEEERFVPLASRTRHSVFDRRMVARLMVGKYKSTYGGAPFIKDVVSQHLYRELVRTLAPATILDLGTFKGGSALWFADIAPDAMVLTFDIDDVRSDACRSNRRIHFHQVDLEDADALRTVLADAPHPWLVSEDCHVEAATIMRSLDDLLVEGDYIVFEDTHPDNPDESGMSAETPTYESGTWSVNKLDSVEGVMTTFPSYRVDTHIQDFYGLNGATFINGVFRKMAS